MEILSAVMVYIVYVLWCLMIWHEVGEKQPKKQVIINTNVFNHSAKLDIRCWSKVSKPV